MKRYMVTVLIAFNLTLPSSKLLANWVTESPVVHEWGVQVFDWSNSKERVNLADLPNFIYTDKKQGSKIAQSEERARDSSPNYGGRNKPLLYFYGLEKEHSRVDVEMRFAFGSPIAWWPQVTIFRDADQVGTGKVLSDWEADMIKKIRAQPDPNREYFRLPQLPADSRRALIEWGHRHHFAENPRPDDDRMQLVWNDLVISRESQTRQVLPGSELPDDHWIRIAREVDSYFVYNGSQAEKFLFYEGVTREKPAIEIGSRNRYSTMSTYRDERNEFMIWNTSPHPIYDVMAVFRDSKKGILWVGYVPMLPKFNIDQKVILLIPDFHRPRERDQIHLSQAEFEEKTKDRLIEVLTHGEVVGEICYGQAPSIPQAKTQHHALFLKEAIGLEKIWHKEMFESEGLTIVYRESPEYLDEAMPLSIFSTSEREIVLSRCGLVINKNISPEKIEAAYRESRRVSVGF